MGQASSARRLASAAVFGGGGLGVVGAGLYGVLTVEAKLARKMIGPVLSDPPPDPTGWYGRGRPGPAVKIAVLGDSSAAGYGVRRVEETPGALLAAGVAEYADRRVHLRDVAVVGARTADLDAQIDAVLPTEPDVAVILIGANDVTHVTPPAVSVRHLAEAVRRLRAAGIAVVVGTCPDLGTIKPIAPPLKQVARAWSRRLAAGQTIAVLEEGGRTVSLASILGPEFAATPALLFGPDQFHPSAEGYRRLASVLLPSTLAAVGVTGDDERELQSLRGERVLPVTEAALQAVAHPGTELGGTEVGGARLGVRGLWVELRHRRRRASGPEQTPEDAEDTEDTEAAENAEDTEAAETAETLAAAENLRPLGDAGPAAPLAAVLPVEPRQGEEGGDTAPLAVPVV